MFYRLLLVTDVLSFSDGSRGSFCNLRIHNVRLIAPSITDLTRMGLLSVLGEHVYPYGSFKHSTNAAHLTQPANMAKTEDFILLLISRLLQYFPLKVELNCLHK